MTGRNILHTATALFTGAFAPLSLTAQCNSTVQGTNGNPYPLVIGAEANCTANSLPVPPITSQHQSSVTPLGCGATQQRDMWFLFTATSAETLIRLYDISAADIGFMVYTGPCANVMTLVTCAGYGQPASQTVIAAIVPTVPGMQYYVRVSRRNSNTLPISMRICGWDFGRIADHPICDDNGSFEMGNTIGWECRYGHYDFTMNLPNAGCLNPDGPNAPLSPGDGTTQPWNAGNRHTIMSDKRYLDPRTNYNVTSVAPGGGNYSFRLGNNDYGCGTAGTGPCPSQASSVALALNVTANNALFTYQFAAVILDPSQAHTDTERPRFEVIATDANGNILNCGYHLYTADLAMFRQGFGIWRYTEWTEVPFDLTPYTGQIVTFEFRVANCYPFQGVGNAGTHAAYAYIDTYCGPVVDDPEPPSCGDRLCAPFGYRNYVWPGQPGLQPPLNQRCVTVTNPIPMTYTVHMETINGCPLSTTVAFTGMPCDVGIGEPRSLPRLEFFPNPVGDRLAIKLDPTVRMESLRVMDAQGRVVLERLGGPQRELDVAGIAPGVYSVRVDTDRGTMAGRFLKE